MKPFTFFRRASAAVAPLPITLTPFHQQFQLLIHAFSSFASASASFPCSIWFVHALHASTTTQTIALDSLKAVVFRPSDRTVIEKYLEDNVTLLDTCNQLSEKMEIVQDYIKSLKVVSHLLRAGNFEPKPTTLARALHLLGSSCKAMQRRFAEILLLDNNCRSSLRKMSRKKLAQHDSEYGEILNGSMTVALMVCGILGNALSFKPKRLEQVKPTVKCYQSMTSWSVSLHEFHKQFKGGKSMMLSELEQIVNVARDLQHHIRYRNKSEVKVVAEELKSGCDDLEQKMMALDRGVRELYKHLISIRMALLGTLSQA